MVRHDALVLAGGAATRLGGVDKATLVVAGRTLLDHALRAAAGAERTVVVGPVAAPDGVQVTTEEPPGGGPVAGIAAGVLALPREPEGAPWVLVLAVDQPGAPAAVPALLAEVARLAEDVDGVCPRDAGGRPQWLLAAYRRTALQRELSRLGSGHGASVRSLVTGLRLHHAPTDDGPLGDVDTWEDHRTWERRLAGGTMAGPPQSSPEE